MTEAIEYVGEITTVGKCREMVMSSETKHTITISPKDNCVEIVIVC